MEGRDKDRFRELEARLNALEARLRAIEGEKPAPPPPPPPLPPSPPPPRPNASKPKRQPTGRQSLEQFIGLKILGRVGMTAVVIAAVYFGKLGWDRLGPIGRVTLIYLGAAAMLAAGFWLRPRVQQVYTALLLGGSVALSYTAGVVAKLGYELVGSGPAMVMLVGSTALGQWLGRLLRLELIATVALGGGYLAPILVGEPSDAPTALLVYALALHTWSAWTEHRWQWHWARALAVAGTVSIMAAWYGTTEVVQSPTSYVLHIEFALLGLVMPELLAVFRAEVSRLRWGLAHAGLWIVQLWLVLGSLTWVEVSAYGLYAGGGWFALALALARARPESSRPADLARLGGTLLAFGLRRFVKAADLAIAVAACLALLLVGQADPPTARWLGLAALAMPASLVWLGGSRTGTTAGLVIGWLLVPIALTNRSLLDVELSPWTGAAVAATSAWLAIGAIASARRANVTLHSATAILFAALALSWIEPAMRVRYSADLMPFANWRFFAALSVLAGIEIARRQRPTRPLAADLPILLVAAGVIAYLAGLLELLEAVQTWVRGWRDAVVSLYSTAFAGALLATGFWKQNAIVRWAGLVGLLLVVLKVALLDLAELDTALRMLVTGVLGLVLLVGAYGYARLQTPPK